LKTPLKKAINYKNIAARQDIITMILVRQEDWTTLKSNLNPCKIITPLLIRLEWGLCFINFRKTTVLKEGI
jgi:hypothetical protein